MSSLSQKAVVVVSSRTHNTRDTRDTRDTRAPWAVIRPRPRVRNEQGAAALELLIVASVLVGFVLVVVAGGRMVDARGQVNDSAYAAARAASLASSGAGGTAAGRSAAQASLTERGRACARLSVNLSGSSWEPGGQVTARVTCRADLADVVGFGIPGAKSFTGTAVVPIEQYRAPT